MTIGEFFHAIGRKGIYSNNLWLFIRKLKKKYGAYHPLEIHYHEEYRCIFIGINIDMDCGFVGANLLSACCNGAKTETANHIYLNRKTVKSKWPSIYVKYGRDLLVVLGHTWWVDRFKGTSSVDDVYNQIKSDMPTDFTFTKESV